MPDLTYKDNTNVPALTWNDNGIVLPEESDILNGVCADLQQAWGSDLKFFNANGDFLASTPQGQHATSIAAILLDVYKKFAYYVNQVDPTYSVGRMQDAIGDIYFIQRIGATNTTVTAKCVGLSGVIIPEGTLVIDANNYTYAANATYKIGENGFVNATFVCQTPGLITLPLHSLKIYQSITGWDSIDNDQDAIVGREIETPQEFERRRQDSVALNSVNSMESILAALLNLTGVTDAYVTANNTGQNTTVDGITINAHSIYCAVIAAEDENMQQTIGKAILNKKPPGVGMTGDIHVVVQDNQKLPDGTELYFNPPSYDIYFSYGVTIPIFFEITITNSPPAPLDAETQIRQAIYNSFYGTNRPRIGGEILASSYYSSIQALGSWAVIITLFVGTSTSPNATKIDLAINQYASLDVANIKVNING